MSRFEVTQAFSEFNQLGLKLFFETKTEYTSAPFVGELLEVSGCLEAGAQDDLDWLFEEGLRT